jgi:hypothetical protein
MTQALRGGPEFKPQNSKEKKRKKERKKSSTIRHLIKQFSFLYFWSMFHIPGLFNSGKQSRAKSSPSWPSNAQDHSQGGRKSPRIARRSPAVGLGAELSRGDIACWGPTLARGSKSSPTGWKAEAHQKAVTISREELVFHC